MKLGYVIPVFPVGLWHYQLIRAETAHLTCSFVVVFPRTPQYMNDVITLTIFGLCMLKN